MQKQKILLILCLFIGTHLSAQKGLNKPRNIQAAYLNGTRDLNGKPGLNYWQNTSSYEIEISFDPDSREINGTVKIQYLNNSPDTLDNILVKLYPNISKKGAVRDESVGVEDVGEGVQIKNIMVRNKSLDLNDMNVVGVNAFLPVEPILPDSETSLVLDYSFILSKDSPSNRTGQINEASFFVAYFFPRIAVYDDIDGWNKYQFLGETEFYNDFSDFKVSITVPDPYIIWATGDHLNRTDIFAEKIIERINKAERSDEAITIISVEDLEASILLLGKEKNTFTYAAKNVTDFAFGVSSQYVWESSSVEVDKNSGRRTRVDVVYNPEDENYRKVLDWNRETVEAMSYKYPGYPFPYSHETVFQGLAQMEFPMMVNLRNSSDSMDLCQVTIHEVFHTMFPFYMGINQKKYGWMDEGWTMSAEWLIFPILYPGEINNYFLSNYEEMAGTDEDYPIMVLSPDLSGNSYTMISYPKPAIAILILKDLLGDEKFYNGLHTFIENWKGKHPIPWDMFYSFNEGSGIDLNWFWDAWFFQNGYPDLSIEEVFIEATKVRITVKKVGALPVPIHLIAKYDDDSQEMIHQDVSVWQSGNSTHTIELDKEKKLIQLKLYHPHIPDVNSLDNVWDSQ